MQQTIVVHSVQGHDFHIGRSLDRYDAGKAWLSTFNVCLAAGYLERRLEGPVSDAPDLSLYAKTW